MFIPQLNGGPMMKPMDTPKGLPPEVLASEKIRKAREKAEQEGWTENQKKGWFSRLFMRRSHK